MAGITGGLLTAWVERHFIGASGADFNFTIIERILIAGRAVWFYFDKLFWPTDLIFIYPRWRINEAIGWQYLFPVAALLLAGALGFLCRRWRGPLAGFLFFVGTLFPALGFFNVFPFLYSFVADHFQYLACLGIIVPCAAGMVLWAEVGLANKPRLQWILGGGLLLTLGILSWQRTWAYQSEEVLWNDTLAKNPGCWMAHDNLGLVLMNKGLLDEAITHFQKTLEINPNFAGAYDGFGLALSRKGRVDEAMKYYQKALEINPDYADSYYNLGMVLVQKGEGDKAIGYYRKALEINSDDADVHNNFGVALVQKGEIDEAIEHYRKALEINPDYADAHYNLGAALVQKGEVDEAIEHYRRVLEINPAYANIHNNFGIALAQKGRTDEAIAQFQKALESNSNDAKVHNNLGIALFQKGRVNEAIAQFQEAIRLDPDLQDAQKNLVRVKARQKEGQK